MNLYLSDILHLSRNRPYSRFNYIISRGLESQCEVDMYEHINLGEVYLMSTRKHIYIPVENLIDAEYVEHIHQICSVNSYIINLRARYLCN